jgi:hypothetical protein
MGVQLSAGHLHIHLDTRNFQAGEQLLGTVHLKLFQGVQARALCLLFDGKEHAGWETEGGSHKGGSHFVRQKFPIFIFTEGYLPPGDYSFPFSFVLPPSLPGSFHLYEENLEAYIRYTLTAFIEGSSGYVELSEVHLHISQLMTDPIYSLTGSSSSRLVSCCRDKGTVQIQISFSKSAYVPGERAEFIAEINNSQSGLDVAGFKVRLFRKLRLRSHGGHVHMRQEQVCFWDITQRVPRGEALLGEQSRHQILDIPDIMGGIEHSTTVHSEYVECVYSILVHLSMAGGCCVSTPEVERPIVIYPRQLPPHLPPMVPQGWAPRLMPMAQFSMGQNYDYIPSPLPRQ